MQHLSTSSVHNCAGSFERHKTGVRLKACEGSLSSGASVVALCGRSINQKQSIMKEIYVICSQDADGNVAIMRDMYSTQESVLQAIKVYQKECTDKLFYYVVGNLLK